MSSKFKAVGGEGKNPALTSLLPEKEYDIGKTHAWVSMIKDRMRPIQWFEKTKDGTSVEFSLIDTDADAELALQELQVYVDEINKKYGIEMHIVQEDSNDGTSRSPKS